MLVEVLLVPAKPNWAAAERRTALDTLHDRQSRVVVCVDMLGEGFDLPQLKVAAIHDLHKSLAVTLQFIGRFARALNAVLIAACQLYHGCRIGGLLGQNTKPCHGMQQGQADTGWD